MCLMCLWHRIVKRPVSDYSRVAAPGVVRQAVRTLGQRPGSLPGRRFVPSLRRAALSPPSPWGRAVAVLVVLTVLLTVLLAGAIPAAAQTPTQWAGNVGQPPAGGLLAGVSIRTDVSQKFTTGSSSDGYSLKHIALRTEGSVDAEEVNTVQHVVASIVCTGDEDRLTDCPWVGSSFSASVCRVLPNGYPDRSACTPLDPPDNFEIGWKGFFANQDEAARKVFLAPNTTYTLLLSAGNQPVVYGVTEADAEDGTSPPGWSIGDNYDYYSSNEVWTSHSAEALRIQIHFITGIPNAVITSVAVTSTPDSDSYGWGDRIEFTVTFNKAVTVGGDPQFNFSLGEVAKAASYDADRSTTTSLVFTYTVQTGDEDTDGIWVGSGPRTFTLDADDHIRTTMGGIDALLDHNVLGTLSDHTVEISSDATLRGLALSNAADDAPITLNPVFAPSLALYTASVAHEVDTITVAATTSHAGARVAYLDAHDAVIPDADSQQVGHQVTLPVGQTIIKGRVTAEDAVTTQTYAVTVSRASLQQDGGSRDATLSELALSANNAPVVLSPDFVPDSTRYTASVAPEVDKITVALTPTHPRAHVAYLDTSEAEIPDADPGKGGHQIALTVGETTIKGRVTAEDGTATATYTVVVSRASGTNSRADVSPPRGTNGSGGSTRSSSGGRSSRSSGGGSGGGGNSSQDDHGNTAAQATPVILDPARMATTAGQLNAPDDVDYFTVAVSRAGTLVIETTGRTDTVGTVWQDGAELATDDNSGASQNFQLSVPVQAGPVVIAVAGAGPQTGAYTLRTTLSVGYLENPSPTAFQSGLGVISGWVCEAEEVEIELNGVGQIAAYGTARADTEAVCGDTDNGFGLLFNWNLLGDGEHEVVAFVDGVELGRATVTVTTLGAEFLRDVTGTCEVEDFPTVGETVTLEWQQSQQNFVLVDGEEPRGANRAGRAGVGALENPGPNAFQSGISVISGWVCEGDAVEIEIGDLGRQGAAYGTERLDTEEVCGDVDNGFGLLFNWNLLGVGEHEVVAYVDNEELGRATVRVTTLGVEFLRGVAGACVVEDFPDMDQTVTLEWQQNSQNFVITGVE